jgi:enamine deaminase RidA (YjgF/YER057c/UK114 family)
VTPEERLAELGIELPQAPAAVGAYVPWAAMENLVVTSFQLPWRDGELAYTGRLGAELAPEDGYQAARICALNGIAQLKEAAGGELDRVRRIIRVEGHVGCAEGFTEIPQVLNGASDLVNEVFGERGRHTRTALGHVVMPLDAAVMIGFWAGMGETAGFPNDPPSPS